MNIILFVDSNNKKYKNVVSKLNKSLSGLATNINILFLKDFDENKNVKQFINNKTCVIAIGGDGTIIKAIKLFYKHVEMIIPYNIGHIGYLSDINSIDEVIKIIKNKKCIITKRYLIRAKIRRQNKIVYNDVSQNEFFISSKIHGYMGKYVMNYIKDDEFINEFHSDGLICATSTGSTGYSLSNGGPIVDKDIKCIIASAIRSHSVGNRSLVLNIEKGIKITVLRNNQLIKSDGRDEFILENGDIIEITMENKFAKIASLIKENEIAKINKKIKGI